MKFLNMAMLRNVEVMLGQILNDSVYNSVCDIPVRYLTFCLFVGVSNLNNLKLSNLLLFC
jgi:hypothetical protein